MRQEALIGCAVVGVAGVVLGFFAIRQGQRTGLLSEAARMRRIYVALSEYEAANDIQPAPNLLAASAYMPSKADYVSDRDPYRQTSGPFPLDGSLPDLAKVSSTRISDAYVISHAFAGKLKLAPWVEYRVDLTAPVLANEWYGQVQSTGNFGAQVSGDVLRIHTDGSVRVMHRSETVALGQPSLWSRTK